MRKQSDLTQFIIAVALSTAVAVYLTVASLGCASAPVYPQNVLADQTLYPHPDFPGLVNRACLERDGEDCVKWNAVVHDTADPGVRQNLQRLTFMCDVGGKLYHPCKDRNGLCRVTYGSRPVLGIIGKKPKKETFLSLAPGPDRDFLIAAKTICSRWGAYDDVEAP